MDKRKIKADPVHDREKNSTGLSRRNFCLMAGIGLLGAGCSSHGSEAGTSACTTLPASLYEVTILGNQREIRANGIPNHVTGIFPNQDDPAAIRVLEARYLVDFYPSANAYATPIHGWLFGIARSGVPFDPTGPFWSTTPGNVWEFEVMSTVARPYLGLDGSNAHAQPNGEYHYHGIPNALISTLQRNVAGGSPLNLGWAADGFPIYGPLGYSDPTDPGSPVRLIKPGYRLKKGKRPSDTPKGDFDGSFVQDYEFIAGSGDLDDCNGRFGAVPEFPEGIYHYYVTDLFPFVSRFYRGTPDKTFIHPLPGPGAVPPALSNFGR